MLFNNATGDLAGTVAATTANTAPVALTEDQTLGVLKTMYIDSPAPLKSLSKTEKVILMDGDSYNNYMTSLEGFKTSTPLFSSEGGRVQMINGIETHRGARRSRLG